MNIGMGNEKMSVFNVSIQKKGKKIKHFFAFLENQMRLEIQSVGNVLYVLDLTAIVAV